MKWTLNSSSLAKGMLIRRPGLDEALEVVSVGDGQAKIKLPGGKTSTIPASAEVEWAMPEVDGKIDKKIDAKPESIAEPDREPEAEDIHVADDGSDWQTDWSLLDVGAKISVLGEVGDFTIIRLTDSSARIKSDRTNQIQALSIGHKFKFVGDDNTTDSKPATTTKPDKAKAKGKAAKPKPATKTRKIAKPEPEPEPEIDEPEAGLFDHEPSDDELAAIENGADTDPIEDDDLDLSGLDDDDNDSDADPDNAEENDPMPKHKSKPASISRSKSSKAPASSTSSYTATDTDTDLDRGSLLTLGQIAERVGISYPTLMRYVRDHGDRMPYEGHGRARRYYPAAIDVVRQIRSEMKGGRPPGSGNKPKPAGTASSKPKSESVSATQSNRPTRTAKPLSTGISFSGSTVTSTVPSGSTIDQALAQAIDHARAQISGLESLIDNLEAQRESLKLWS